MPRGHPPAARERSALQLPLRRPLQQGKYKESAKAAREAIGRYELRDKLLGLYYVQLAVAQYSNDKQNEALEAVGRAKALGVQEHESFSTIEKGGKKKKG